MSYLFLLLNALLRASFGANMFQSTNCGESFKFTFSDGGSVKLYADKGVVCETTLKGSKQALAFALRYAGKYIECSLFDTILHTPVLVDDYYWIHYNLGESIKVRDYRPKHFCRYYGFDINFTENKFSVEFIEGVEEIINILNANVLIIKE